MSRKVQRPFFLDWRYYVSLIVAIAVSLENAWAFGLWNSNWRYAIYFGVGLLQMWSYDRWVEWHEANK